MKKGSKGTRAVSKPSAPSLRALLESAHALADASGKVILPHFRRAITVDNKGRDGIYDPVTAADRAAEKTIARLIAKHWPDHGLVGEEFGSRNARARIKWVIDPIDGTRAFITGSLLWGTLIGVLEGETPIFGLVDQPYTKERFWSGASSAHMRSADAKQRRIRTRACPRLSDAILMTTHPDMFADAAELDAFQRVKSRARMTRYGGDCYSYCLLSAGFVDAVIESGLQPFDVIALIPIVERAGGVITSWEGGSAARGGRVVVSGDPRLHQEILKIINK